MWCHTITWSPKLNDLPKFLQRQIYKKQAKQIAEALNIEAIDIVWSFDPYRFFDQNAWPVKTKIYHTVDVHFKPCFETDMANSSDLVLLSSELLRAKLAPFNNNIHYTGHAADLDHFESVEN